MKRQFYIESPRGFTEVLLFIDDTEAYFYPTPSSYPMYIVQSDYGGTNSWTMQGEDITPNVPIVKLDYSETPVVREYDPTLHYMGFEFTYSQLLSIVQ